MKIKKTKFPNIEITNYEDSDFRKQRLIKFLNLLKNKVSEASFDLIKQVHDHKGILFITVSSSCSNVFKQAVKECWEEQGEHEVTLTTIISLKKVEEL